MARVPCKDRIRYPKKPDDLPVIACKRALTFLDKPRIEICFDMGRLPQCSMKEAGEKCCLTAF